MDVNQDAEAPVTAPASEVRPEDQATSGPPGPPGPDKAGKKQPNPRAKKSAEFVENMYETWIKLGKNAKATGRALDVSESTVRAWRDRQEWLKRSMGIPTRSAVEKALEAEAASIAREVEIAKAERIAQAAADAAKTPEEADPELWSLYRVTRKMLINRMKQLARLPLGKKLTPAQMEQFEKKPLKIAEYRIPQAIKTVAEVKKVLDQIARQDAEEKRAAARADREAAAAEEAALAAEQPQKFEGDLRIEFKGEEMPTLSDMFLALRQKRIARSGTN